MSEPAKPAHPLASAGVIVGAIGGWTLSQYCGPAGWIPLLAVIVLFLLFSKTPFRPRWFVGAVVVTGAHVIWFVVGSAATGVWSATLLDIVVLLAALIWIWLSPGLASASFLGLIQAASLAYTVYLISSIPFGDPMHRALTAHGVFRALALVTLVVGYRNFRKGASGSGSADVTPAAAGEQSGQQRIS